MAKYILDQTQPYNAVVHFGMPVGTNAVGTPWKSCYLAWYAKQHNGSQPQSRLRVGTGSGEISQSVVNLIATGDLIEIGFTYGDDPAVTDVNAKNVLIDTYANRAIDEFTANISQQFKYYGYTRP
jgi:hypothetical protein